MQAADLQFDAATHTYRVAGERWPSVTQVLDQLDVLARIPQHLLDAAAAFGTAVHDACHLDDLGILNWELLDPHLKPYVQGWRKFQLDTGAKIVAAEQMVVHRRLRYCGKLDRRCRISGVDELVEIKSTAVMPETVGAQTAAYVEALGMPKLRRRAVQLLPDGTYRSQVLKSPADWNLFLSCLNVHQWRAARGLI